MDKEKQIEEIALDLNSIIHFKDNGLVARYATAEAMYELGYRKQSKGEWVRQNKIKGKVIPEAVCSECGREVVYQVIDNKYFFENFCPHCGARMKGESND
jgi:uncharacterized protein with PIN domain